MLINGIAKREEKENKKKEQDKKNFHIFTIENGEIFWNQMLLKISNQ